MRKNGDPIQIGILENNRTVCDQIQKSLEYSAEFSISFCSHTFPEFCDQMQQHSAEIILFNIDWCSIKILHNLLDYVDDSDVPSKIIVVTEENPSALFFRGIPYNLRGCIHKSHLESPLLPSLLRTAIEQDSFVTCSRISTQMASLIKRQMLLGMLGFLSERERVILHYLAIGYQYKEIGAELASSINTIRSHIKAIYRKLHVNNKEEAVRYLENRETEYLAEMSVAF